MARRTSLREFQAYLSERFASRAEGSLGASLLAVEAGESRWVLSLQDSGEVVRFSHLEQVPMTKPSFVGLANVRGNLHAVTDWSVFLGGKPTPRTNAARLLLVGTRYGSNAALLVSRTLGLRSREDYLPGPAPAQATPWCQHMLTDRQGQHWNLLAVPPLLAEPAFLNIGD